MHIETIYFQVLCTFWQVYGGVNANLLQEDSCHTHTQSQQRNHEREHHVPAAGAHNHLSCDVEQADREGEVRGRNTKIEEKLRKGGKSDGTANLGSKNGGGKGASREMPDLGAIDQNYGTQNIWERGGEKRRPNK